MSVFTSQKADRRDLSRRIADQAIDDLYSTFSTPHCHSCLERTADAVLLLDSKRGVIYITPQADQLITRLKFPPFTLVPRFTLSSSSDAARFSAFVNGKNADREPLILLTGKRNQDPLLLSCIRLPQPAVKNLSVASYLITLRNPHHYSLPKWHFFIEEFNLTRAEARLCRALADGLTLNDYCANWHVTLNTARSQLRSIFAKTLTHGQSDLLRLIYLFTWM